MKGAHMNARRSAGALVFLAVPLLIAACSSTSQSSEASSGSADGVPTAGSSEMSTPTTPAGSSYSATPVGGIPGALLPEERKLWTYDSATGEYAPVDGDATSYEVKLNKPDKPLTIAYMDPWGTNLFAIPIREGVQKISDDLGINLIYCDTEFKPEKAVSCAELVAQQAPDFAIAGNWQAGAAGGVMGVLDKAKIPAASIDVVHPNAIFFGADNYTSGKVAGTAAGEYAKSAWQCQGVHILLGENLEEGEAADQRLVGFQDGVQEVCGALPENQIARIRMAAGTTDQAITATTDWLTANPQAEHVLATTIDDQRASGIAKALVATGRDGRAVGIGCDAVGIDVVKSAPAETNKYLGCVAYYPEKYADYLMSIALDVTAGNPVPNEVHLSHDFLDHDTIGTVYP